MSSGIQRRNPMDLLKRPAPLLSMEAYEAEVKPLDDLRDAAGRDETCVWNRVRPCENRTCAVLDASCGARNNQPPTRGSAVVQTMHCDDYQYFDAVLWPRSYTARYTAV